MQFSDSSWLRFARCVIVLVGALLAAAPLGGCRRDAPPEIETEDPAEPAAPPQPEVPEGTTERIQEKAVVAGQTPEKTREDLIREEIIFEYSGITPAQRKGTAMVNAEGKLCWPAMTCTNPRCSGKGKNGQPFLFAYHYRAVTVGPDGQPDFSANATAPPLVLLGTCPACFMTKTVEPYLPPEERKRFAEITRRVMKKARENAAITQSGRLLTSEEYAEYRKLLEEQADVPVYYLCP